MQVSCAEEWQWLIRSPCMQLALAEQLARAEWKPALCCRAGVSVTEEIKTSAYTGDTQGQVQVECGHSYLLDRLSTECTVCQISTAASSPMKIRDSWLPHHWRQIIGCAPWVSPRSKRPFNALNASVFVLITNGNLRDRTADTSEKAMQSWRWTNSKCAYWGQNNSCLDGA